MLLICNPVAGVGKGKEILNKVCKFLRKASFPYEFEETKYSGEAEEISEKAVAEGRHRRIIAIGGDGTINEVIQSLVGKDIYLGIIPAGTGNDFAYTHGISSSTASISQILAPAPEVVEASLKEINVGYIEIPEYNFKRYFINVVGMGFDAKVAQRALEINFGIPKVNYFFAVLNELFRFSEINLEWEGEERSFLEVIVSNGIREGGYFKIAQKLHPLFNLLTIDSVSFIERPFYLLKAMLGRIWECKGVEYNKVSSFKVKTKSEVLIHIDGDPFLVPLNSTIKIKEIPKALRVIQPAVI